jgi:hypothetical protein
MGRLRKMIPRPFVRFRTFSVKHVLVLKVPGVLVAKKGQLAADNGREERPE